MGRIRKNLNDLYVYLGSLNFFITLLIILTLASVVGTLLLQKPLEEMTPYERYKDTIPEPIIEAIDAIGLFDVYHSVWFISLLVLVVVSIVCCTIKHIQKKALPKIRQKNNVAKARSLGFRLIFEFIKVQYSGVYLTHISIIIILAGAIYNLKEGYEGNLVLLEGQTKGSITLRNGTMLPLSFQIKCDDFNIEYYGNTSRPKEFTSALKVIEEGQIIKEQVIEVNDPLVEQGIYFYQSGYEKAPLGDIILRAHIKNDPAFAQNIVLAEGGSVTINAKDETYELQYLGINSNLNNMGEIAQVALFKKGEKIGEFPLFKKYPNFDCEFRAKEGLCFTVNGFSERYYTVLSVGYNPGINIVWAGAGLLVVGIVWIFVVLSRKRKSVI